MDPASALKLFSDLFLYLSLAGLFAPSMKMALPLMGAAALASVSLLLYERNVKTLYRVLVLLPAACCLLLIRSLSDAFLLIPPLAYLCATALTGRSAVDREEFLAYFKPAACILLVAIPAGILFDRGSGRTLQNALPAAVILLVFALLLLRTLRHNPITRREPRSVLMNFALPLAAVLLAFLFLKLGLLSLLGNGLGFVYDKVLYPLILGLAYVIFGIIWVFQKVFLWLFRNRIEDSGTGFSANIGSQEAELGIAAGEGSDLVGKILTALGILLGAAILFFLFRAVIGRRAEQLAMEETDDRRNANAPEQKKPRPSIFAPRTPREQVRRYFKKTVQRAEDAGIAISDAYTSEKIVACAAQKFDREALFALRALYIRARYSYHEITKADAREAKRLFEEIKKSRVEEEKA